jgi:hypothetical protein
VLSTYSLLLEEWSFSRYTRFSDRMRLLMYLVLESFGYRQLTVIWRLRGLWKYLRGRTDWGRMERRGFASSAVTPASAPPSAPALAPTPIPAHAASIETVGAPHSGS